MNEGIIREVLSYLCTDLGGDWFLTGGSLVWLKFDSTRGTEDMDFVQISHPALSEVMAKNELYKWLIQKDLGPEWVNDAVEPFVRAVPNWQNELVEIQSGKKGRIFRPNLTLFVLLKLNRASEIDLKDITTVAPKCAEGFDEKKFDSWASQKIKSIFAKHRKTLGL